MPEDEIKEESQELDEEQEAEAAFEEEAADEPDKDAETDKELDDTDKPEETEKPEESTDDKAADKSDKTAESTDDKAAETEKKGDEEKEQPAEETARERVEKRLKDVSDDEEQEQELEKKPAPAAKDTVKGRLTKEDVGFYLDHLSDDELPDAEIVIGDRTVNLKELREEEPEMYNGMKVMAGYMFDKSINQLAKSGAIATGKQIEGIQKALTDANNRIEDLNFWNDVAEVYPECRKLMKDKDFGNWIDGQGSKAKRLSQNLETPQDAIDLIGMHYEDIASAKAKDHDDKAGAKKKNVDDIHKHTMRQTKKAAAKATEDDVDPEKAFAEEATELEKEGA